MKKSFVAGVCGSVVGGVTGTVAGFAHIPVTVGFAMVAPVSYPLSGLALGYLSAKAENKGKDRAILRGLAGLVAGITMVPLAPVNMATSPLVPIAYGICGATLGGLMGIDAAKKANNK